MSELKPCPFCGTQPKLPDGDGTQYEIWCEDCGGAVASVQICDLMTIDERASDSFKDYRYGEVFVERAKLEAIDKWNTRAPAEDVRAVVEEPVRLTAVATLRDDGDGGLEADWLLEGGTSELFEGMILLVADNDPTLCEDDGSAELYRRPQRPVLLPERKPKTELGIYSLEDEGYNACLDAVEELNK